MVVHTRELKTGVIWLGRKRGYKAGGDRNSVQYEVWWRKTDSGDAVSGQDRPFGPIIGKRIL